jgi:hypothetical protein
MILSGIILGEVDPVFGIDPEYSGKDCLNMTVRFEASKILVLLFADIHFLRL